LHSLDFSLSIPFFEDGCVLGVPVFNAFGVIPQFPAIADKLLAETARLAAKLHEAYNSLRGFAADCEVPGDLTLTRRILLESPFGSPQEVAEKR
jgi:hypothetical protein